jgi:glutamate/tyrosine decarboxylase-like PLP-dependent enzyme
MPVPSDIGHGESAATPYQSVLQLAAERSQAYLAQVGGRFAGVPLAALQQMAGLGGEMPMVGEDPLSIIRLLDEAGSPATMAVMGGRFFGGVIGGALPVTVAAHWLADAWNQNACLYELSPVSAYLEQVVLDWLIDLFGLPNGTAGALVTGTQMADVTALAAARHALLRRCGWDVESDGLFGAPPITVIVGEEVHATMLKALSILGFGKARVLTVPADAHGRMRASEVPRIAGPTIVCAQVGNVNSGACDPVADLCDIAHSRDAWVHVDGAFGMWAAIAPARRHLVEGVALGDSWATDGHKWLNTPLDCGIAFVRDGEALGRAMSISGAYYGTAAGRDPMRWSPESSRRARAIEVWAALRSLGRDGIAAQIERTCQHATTFASGLRDAGYAIVNDVVLNQVLVSFGSDATTERVIDAVQREGTCWCGGTVWKGRTAMRISVSSWATTHEDVVRSIDAICRAAARIKRGANFDPPAPAQPAAHVKRR